MLVILGVPERKPLDQVIRAVERFIEENDYETNKEDSDLKHCFLRRVDRTVRGMPSKIQGSFDRGDGRFHH